MENLTPQQWAEGLRSNLTLGGERVPFERALGHHLAGLAALRARGLTWRSLANLLKKNGIKRPNGQIYSADHLRVSYDRLTKEPENRSEPPQPLRREEWAAKEKSAVTERRPSYHADGRKPDHVTQATNLRTPTTPSESVATGKDLSADELARIATRLNKFKI